MCEYDIVFHGNILGWLIVVDIGTAFFVILQALLTKAKSRIQIVRYSTLRMEDSI
jgi:hypothetical protein